MLTQPFNNNKKDMTLGVQCELNKQNDKQEKCFCWTDKLLSKLHDHQRIANHTLKMSTEIQQFTRPFKRIFMLAIMSKRQEFSFSKWRFESHVKSLEHLRNRFNPFVHMKYPSESNWTNQMIIHIRKCKMSNIKKTLLSFAQAQATKTKSQTLFAIKNEHALNRRWCKFMLNAQNGLCHVQDLFMKSKTKIDYGKTKWIVTPHSKRTLSVVHQLNACSIKQ